ncbi:MAG: cell wall metabolism sensor histidine kinase WalK, partial [Candidatus Omnitrophica bacterium]|nr:cell wall metabolism sensor histidine kinase WalK [Candidatus Omnitrophota bacterium]
MFFSTNRKLRAITKTLKEIVSDGTIKKIHAPGTGTTKELADAVNETLGTLQARGEMLRVKNAQLEAVITSMAEGVIALDAEQRIVLINPASQRIFGILESDVRGKFFLEVVRNNEIFEIVSAVFATCVSISKEVTFLSPIRTIFKVSATPLTADTAIKGCVLLFYDMTEIRKLESTRAEFVANISHELKTPLTSIKGFVETLLEGAIDDKKNRENFLHIIQEHTERLEHLISELLELSRIESRHLVLRHEPIALKNFIDSVRLDYAIALQKKHIALTNNIPLHISALADKEQLLRVISNIIDNAIKFNTENGTITIECTETQGTLRISVQDSGVGITHGDRERVFERFYQVNKSRAGSKSGAGLGLAIAKHIIELHGGSIGVESAEGQGSIFWFTLPIT